MVNLVSEEQRRRMRKHFRELINSIQAFQLFPRKVRNMLAERLLDVAIAEEEEREPLEFPPDGFEVVFTKIGYGDEQIAATMSKRMVSSEQREGEKEIETLEDKQPGES